MTVEVETGTVGFEFRRSRYDLVLDMRAIAFFERNAGMSIITGLQELETAREEGRPPMISVLAYLMQAGLRKHHPEVSAEQAMAMVLDDAVTKALGTAVAAATPDASDQSDPSAEGNGTAPPAKPRQPKVSSNGSSSRRSKRG